MGSITVAGPCGIYTRFPYSPAAIKQQAPEVNSKEPIEAATRYHARTIAVNCPSGDIVVRQARPHMLQTQPRRPHAQFIAIALAEWDCSFFAEQWVGWVGSFLPWDSEKPSWLPYDGNSHHQWPRFHRA